MDVDALVDQALCRVLCVTLDRAKASPQSVPPVFLWENQEGIPRLNADVAEGVVVDLLSSPPAGLAQTPLWFLLGCYGRASHELRTTVSYIRDKEKADKVYDALKQLQKIIVNYACLLLTAPEVFPQPPGDVQRGPLLLLDALSVLDDGSPAGDKYARASFRLPVGFLEDAVQHLAMDDGDDAVDAVVHPILRELGKRPVGKSPLVEVRGDLALLSSILTSRPVALSLLRSKLWLPEPSYFNPRNPVLVRISTPTGRNFQGGTALGTYLAISPIPDLSGCFPAMPSVIDRCFHDPANMPQADISNAITSLRLTTESLVGALHATLHALLKDKATRRPTLVWLASVVDANMELAKMSPDPWKASTSGFMFNLAWVMLRLSEPFTADVAKAFQRLTPDYVADPVGSLLNLGDHETRMSATTETVEAFAAEVAERRASGAGASGSAAAASQSPPTAISQRLYRVPSPDEPDGPYSFICECFFLTARALHLGPIRVLTTLKNIQRQIHRVKEELFLTEAELSMTAPGTARHRQLSAEAAQTKDEIRQMESIVLCMVTAVYDPKFLTEAMGFVRLVALWLVHVALGGQQLSGNWFRSDASNPRELAVLPEHLVEDACEVLAAVGNAAPHLLDQGLTYDLMQFFCVFLGRPQLIRNPYLRSKMIDVLWQWLPSSQDRQPRYRLSPQTSLAHVFETPLVVSALVPALIRIYIDIEFTERHNQFYEKFSTRAHIGDLFEHLWENPGHRATWRQYAYSEPDVYVRFCNMMLNDGIFLLDETLRLLPDIKEEERTKNDNSTWSSMNPEQRQELDARLQEHIGHVTGMLELGQSTMETLHLSTQEVQAPFLGPMVNRVAEMLNYFLLHLAGPARKSLAVSKDLRSKIGFRPEELLASVVKLYLNLFHADREGALVKAIVSEGRSFRPTLFAEAEAVIRDRGIVGSEELHGFAALARAVEEAGREGAEEDDILAEVGDDVPEEFLDPILGTVMKDPVLLTTSGHVVDRDIITRHLLTDQKDPFNRQDLTIEMLQPQEDLRRQIEAWMADLKAQRHAKAN